jgi:hypothetical protein
MTGGIITNNVIAGTTKHGAGVCVEDDSLFTMTGGTITNNTSAHAAGGVAIIRGSTFILKGGTIAANTAELAGGGVYVSTGVIKKEAGGIIYGSTSANPYSNKVTDPVLEVKIGKGHAVYVEAGPKKLETTVGTDATLDSTKDGAPGGWAE